MISLYRNGYVVKPHAGGFMWEWKGPLGFCLAGWSPTEIAAHCEGFNTCLRKSAYWPFTEANP